MDREHLIELKEWLDSEVVDDPEDLFDEVETIIDLIDFWLERNHEWKIKK
mgnify:CR=1 FL=1